jgi:hypothetical protein
MAAFQHSLAPLLLALSTAAPGFAVGAATPSARVALAQGELRAGLRAAGAGSEIELRLARPDGSIVALPAPGTRTGALLDEPTPVVAAAELAGLAWLEGATRESYGVRFAPWTGAGWGAAEEVAAPGPGSQLALAPARLADGRLLLVWAAYDGGDDEIRFALRSAAGVWSAAARVAEDNAVPDITPAATATADGALVAWSRYVEGEYRVALARFDGERFRAAKVVGRPGTLFPGFEAPGPDGELRLLFRNARPTGWTLAELDRSGAIQRQWFVEAREATRPTEVTVKNGRVELRFDAPSPGSVRP